MKAIDIVKEVKKHSDKEKIFIKWWRKENDFADYDLVDTFLKNIKKDHEFAGYELLDKEQMWGVLQAHCADHVALDKKRGQDVIIWDHETSEGEHRQDVCAFTPESMMLIFDVETRGDVID